MNTFVGVMLTVMGINSDGRPIQHHEAMPDMDTCLMEAGKFVRHRFPDMANIKHIGVACEGDVVKENPA